VARPEGAQGSSAPTGRMPDSARYPGRCPGLASSAPLARENDHAFARYSRGGKYRFTGLLHVTDSDQFLDDQFLRQFQTHQFPRVPLINFITIRGRHLDALHATNRLANVSRPLLGIEG
jgi:hypothetical protein